MEVLPIQEEIIEVKGQEHLRRGVKPIMACTDGILDRKARYIDLGCHQQPVNFYDDAYFLKKEGYLTGGDVSYVISPIEKYAFTSDNYVDCTGMAVVGLELGGDENLAFITHQNPDSFLKDTKEKFIEDIQFRLKEIKTRCEKGTIDVVLFGGLFTYVEGREDSDPSRKEYIQEYIDSIKLLSEQVYEVLGFYPEVVVGPKLAGSSEAITFDTYNRRLYLGRYIKEGNKSSEFIKNFNSKDIDTISQTWKSGEFKHRDEFRNR